MKKKLLSMLLALVMVLGMLPISTLAVSDTITITVRVYDESTGTVYDDIATDTVKKNSSLQIESELYRIPELSQFTNADYGRVTKVVGSWYFPAGDSSVGAGVYWSSNTSKRTMTYWVTYYTPKDESAGSGTGNDGTLEDEDLGGYGSYTAKVTLKYHSNYPDGTDYVVTKNYTAKVLNANSKTNVWDFADYSDCGFGGYTPLKDTETWYKDAECTAEISSLYVGDGDVVDLYAGWEKPSSGGETATPATIIYKDGEQTVHTQSALVGDTVTTFTPNAKEGWIFKGWSETSGGTVKYAAGEEFTVTNSNTIFYAVWEEAEPEPTPSTPVAPSAPSDLSDILTGDEIVVVDCVNTEIDPAHADGKYALLAASYTIGTVAGDTINGYTCDVTINAEKYVAQYNTDIGTEHTVEGDTSKTITLIWNAEDEEWKAPENASVTFQVKCETPGDPTPETIVFTYHSNYEPDKTNQITYTYNQKMSLPGALFEREGYELIGWSLYAEGGHTFGASQNISNNYTNKDRDFYARWTANQYTVSFDANLKDVSDPESILVTYDAAYGELPTPEAPSDAYKFLGWYLNGEEVTAETIVKTAGDHTLTAKWEQTVTFHANYDGAEPATKTVTIIAGQGMNLLGADTFTRTGYTLVKWGNHWLPNKWTKWDPETYIGAGHVETDYYAKWEANEYTVNFHCYDNNDSVIIGTTKYDSYLTTVDGDKYLTRTGYTFKGWAVEEGGEVVYGGNASIYPFNDENFEGEIDHDKRQVDLYAVWKAKQYTIVYHGNGAYLTSDETKDQATSRVTYDTKVALKNGDTFTHPEKDGIENWAFLGWAYTADGEVKFAKTGSANKVDFNVTNFPELETTTDGKVHLYAVWTPVIIELNPVNAAYKVEHYKQLPNGTYELAETDFVDENGKPVLFGEVGKEVAAVAKDYGSHYSENTEHPDRIATGVVTMPAVENGELSLLTLKLYYKLDTHTVTYTDGVDREEVFEDQVYTDCIYGSDTPDFEGTPARTGYVFAGWTPAVDATVSGDTTYTATWKVDRNGNGVADETEYVTVTYTDGVEGTEVFADQVYDELLVGDATPAFVGTPTRRGYTFIGWKPVVAATVTGNATYVAQWRYNYVYYPVVDNDPTVKVKGLNTTDHVAYIIGIGNNEVNPLGTITRAEVATIYFRLMTDEFRAKYWDDSNSYTDVADTAWYNVAISTLENAGVIQDTAKGGEFRPNDPITRAELAVMAAQFCTITGKIPAASFKDVDKDHWAADEIALVEYAGWIEGYAGYYRPEDNLTRAECVTIVNRMLQRGAEAENMLDDMLTFVDNMDEDMWYYEAVQEAVNSHTYTRTTKKLTGKDFRGEKWVKIEEAPDWAALEKAWAEAK